MEVWFHRAVPFGSLMENQHLGLCRLPLRCVWQWRRKQVRIHHYSQRRIPFIQKFKEMVGGLFDGMMEEVGLDNEQLAYLLEKGFESKQRKIFAQLLLVDDFLKFKTLMVNRNKALEAEAMKALQESQHPEVAHSKHHHKGVSQE